MVEVRELDLPGLREIVPAIHADERGRFSEVWNAEALARHGIDWTFVQDNHVQSDRAGVLRGLHFQLAPFEQGKLVRVARGAIFDVAVDLRRDSPAFGRWAALTLSAEAGNQMLIPGGFAHGYVALEPDTHVLYKVTAPYSAAHERAIRFDDPDLAIAWPFPAERLILSDKDRHAPSFAQALAGAEA